MSGGGAGGGGVAVECRSPRGAPPPHQHRLTVRCLSVCLWEFWHILRLPLAASNNPADLCAAPLPFWPFISQRVWFNQQVTIFSVEIFGSYNWSYMYFYFTNKRVANYFFRFCVYRASEPDIRDNILVKLLHNK